MGRVSRIEILQQQNNKILVELDVGGDVVLGDSTKALLFNVDFLGSKGIQLDIKQVNGVLADGDTLYSELEGGISDIAERQIDNLALTISRINDILLGMQGSGEEIKETIIAFKGTLTRVNAAIDQSIFAWTEEKNPTNKHRLAPVSVGHRSGSCTTFE